MMLSIVITLLILYFIKVRDLAARHSMLKLNGNPIREIWSSHL